VTEELPSTVVLARATEIERVTPNTVRITLDGPGVERIRSGGNDQRIKLLFAREGQRAPVLPDAADWYGSYRAMAEDERPAMRTFTVRSQCRRTGRLDVEFALHDGPPAEQGPAAAWARAAEPGAPVGIVGPTAAAGAGRGVEFDPGDADWSLIVGDDTAVPAVAAVLEQLPADAVVRVHLQVATQADVRSLSTAADAQIVWLTRDDPADPSLCEAVRRADLPAGRPYARVAGEASLVRELRHHLLREREWERGDHHFGGYWRAGHAEGAE
jgi:NADPH-dependent ferric siderophore reductase